MYCVYKIQIDNECYIGSTKNFNKRFKDHQYRKNDEKYKHLPLYKKMNETENFEMNILEMFDCDKKTIFIKEQEYITKFKPSLNSRGSIINKDIQREKNKIRMRNRTEEQKALANARNKDSWKKDEDIICDCGGKYKKRHKYNHFKTKKHLNFVN